MTENKITNFDELAKKVTRLFPDCEINTRGYKEFTANNKKFWCKLCNFSEIYRLDYKDSLSICNRNPQKIYNLIKAIKECNE